MNAILVFDPSNDLLFVKSDKLFRAKLLKYARRQGLLTGRASSSPSSASDGERDRTQAPLAGGGGGPSQAPGRRAARRRCSCALDRHIDDDNKHYLEILMLLLTPYVASLRLAGAAACSGQQFAYNRALRWQRAAGAPRHAQAAAGARAHEPPASATDDLLAKFMSSISLHHECDTPLAGACHSDSEPVAPAGQDALPAAPSRPNFCGAEMPIECLEDCQVVYCELYDFVFVYMQQLDSVSSFKMRLLQKRVDVFARLALLLFGPALACLRPRAATAGHRHLGAPAARRHVDPAQILRQAYDCWFANQFEPEFLLEANERLIISNQIESVCQQTLKSILLSLRAAAAAAGSHQPAPDTHQHALIFSSDKLISRYSCLNSRPLQQEDLILVLVLLKTFNSHHGNELDDELDDNPDEEDGQSGAPSDNNNTCYYVSRYAANRHTYEIFGSSSSSGASKQAHHKSSPSSARQRWRSGCKFCQDQTEQRPKTPGANKLPSQFPVFLSTPGPFGERLRVPNMIRFVILARGVTLILIDEISSSYLSYQLSKAHKLLLEFGKTTASWANLSLAAANNDARWSSTSSLPRLRLGQLAKVNDCVSAIKSYFYGQNFESSSGIGGDGRGARGGASLAPAAQGDGFVWADAKDQPQPQPQPQQQQQQQRRRQQQQRQQQHRHRQQSQSSWLLSDFVDKYFKGNRRLDGGASSAWSASAASSYAHLSGWDNILEHGHRDRFADNEPAGDGAQAGGAYDAGTDDATDGHANEEDADAAGGRVFDSLDFSQRRLCRHLLRKLDELASSNVHTYMRQTFGLAGDERRREALLTSVCATVRDSLAAFVLEPQLVRLNDLAGAYLRRASAQMDRARLVARHQLADYLEYLAVKAKCNARLGAPLTHDMPALRCFVYVDRRRQQLIRSPVVRTRALTWRELVEGDFGGALERLRRANTTDSCTDSDDAQGGVARASSDADESDMAPSAPRPAPAPAGAWLMATSHDLVAARSSSSSLGTGSRQSVLAAGSSAASLTDAELAARPAPPVDHTLAKGLAAFAYNRLATGRASFTTNDGTYSLAYFIWFRRTSVRSRTCAARPIAST